MTRLLLDSHVMLWYDHGTLRSDSHVEAIRSADEVFVSAASFWELTIKHAAAKLPIHTDLFVITQRNHFRLLAITAEHGFAAGWLPLHHRDPFDRMLVAQAQLEGLTLVTHDDKLQQYGIPILLV